MMKKRTRLAVSLVLVFTLIFGACAPTVTEPPVDTQTPTAAEPPAETPQTSDEGQENVRAVVDQAGRTVTIEDPVERIISGFIISSSAVLALGLEDRLVGIEARADERPLYALAAPQLIELPSVGTMRDFNLEGAVALAPDLVILPMRQLDNAEILTELGIPVIVVEPENPEALMEMIVLIAEATGVPERAVPLIDFYNRSLEEINQLTADIHERPVVYMAGVGSYLTVAPRDMYQSSMITLAGGQIASGDIPGNSWVEISYEQLLTMNPEVIILPSEAGYSIEDVLNNPQLAQISAVQNGRVYQMPNAFESWDTPIPSFTLGIRWLLSVLHEEVYPIESMREYAAAFYAAFFRLEIDTTLIER